jgi:hypothetical protein
MPPREFVVKWIYQVNDSVTGHVELGIPFKAFKNKFTESGKKGWQPRKKAWIYVCPYCFTYFCNKFTTFLHLQPGEW